MLPIRFWRSYNAHLLRSAEQSSQLASLRATYAADSATLERLERTNVYNDAFCIGHDGVFGTINSLRLGRVPGVPVGPYVLLSAWKFDRAYFRLSGLRLMLLGDRPYFCYTQSPGNWILHSKSMCCRTSTRHESLTAYAVIAWFLWDPSLALRGPLATKQRMSCMDQAIYISGDCCITDDSTLRW